MLVSNHLVMVTLNGEEDDWLVMRTKQVVMICSLRETWSGSQLSNDDDVVGSQDQDGGEDLLCGRGPG